MSQSMGQFIDIDADDLRELIEDQGETFDWYKARRCPCSQSHDASAESMDDEGPCSHGCENGVLFVKQDLDASVRALVTNYNKERFSLDTGYAPSGKANWTAMADDLVLRKSDRIILTSREEPAQELVKRGTTGTPGVPGTLGLGDVLAHPYVCKITAITQGLDEWKAGRDFTFETGPKVGDSRVIWLTNTPPVTGSYYSAEYYRRPRLHNLEDNVKPFRRNFAGEKLVQRLSLTIMLPNQREGG